MANESSITICGHGSGTPSTKNLATYASSRYAQIAGNGVRKGIVRVMRLKALKDEDRPRFTATYKTILGRNKYSQDLRAYVYEPRKGVYYSDCSSSIMATFQQLGYNVSLLNTAGIYSSPLFENVPVSIAAGHIMNPELLKVGDCILFCGNDASRPLQIGHVEAVYDIPTNVFVYTEKEVDAKLTIVANELNIRLEPNSIAPIVGAYKAGDVVHVNAKSETWFKTDKGWINRNYVKGWIYEDDRYWYIENGVYPMHCARDIDGQEYHFDKDGWMLTPGRINDSGAVNY